MTLLRHRFRFRATMCLRSRRATTSWRLPPNRVRTATLGELTITVMPVIISALAAVALAVTFTIAMCAKAPRRKTNEFGATSILASAETGAAFAHPFEAQMKCSRTCLFYLTLTTTAAAVLSVPTVDLDHPALCVQGSAMCAWDISTRV